MKQQSGFTLIELIMVIVILGILAATALPKFSNVSVDARIAKMQGVAASLKAAAAMAHGQSLALGSASNVAVTLEDGTSLAMSQSYPAPYQAGIERAVDVTGVSATGSATVSGYPGWAFYPDTSRRNCVVLYSIAPNSATPVIDDTKVTGATTVGGIGSAVVAEANCS